MIALYINLARSPARRVFMDAQSERLGVALTRLDAVDGREIPEPTYQRLCPDDGAGVRLARNELACFLSHVLAWEILARGEDRFGAVFEDDVYLPDAAAAFLCDKAWVPLDADVVKLTANPYRVTLSEAPVTAASGRGLHRMRSETVDSGGYVIAARHARRLVEGLATYRAPVDRFLMNPAGGAVIYQVMPAIGIQAKWADFAFLSDESGSLIQSEKPKRPPRSIAKKLSGELRNLRVKVIAPLALPATQLFRPKDQRVMITSVPFGR